jgi:MFS transporter, MHS family, proline/betaine transporter
LFWAMYHPSPALILFGQIGFGALIGLFGGTQPAIMVEASPARIRCTAVALGYNTALAVFGGLSPLAATWLVERTADEIAPAYLIMAAAAVSLLAVWRMRETYRVPLT